VTQTRKVRVEAPVFDDGSTRRMVTGEHSRFRNYQMPDGRKSVDHDFAAHAL
jgi:hypothetical protein